MLAGNKADGMQIDPNDGGTVYLAAVHFAVMTLTSIGSAALNCEPVEAAGSYANSILDT